MAELLRNPRNVLGAGVILVIFGVVLGTGATLFIASGGSEIAGVGPVILDSGGTNLQTGPYHSGSAVGGRKDVSEALPLTAAEAVTAGWDDPIMCDPGRGRYFRKGPEGEGEPYFLMYDVEDKLIGIYLHSEAEMPLPWRRWEELLAAGGQTFLGDHWGLLVYFRDPTRSCKKTGDQDPTGMRVGYYLASAVRGTPTPQVAPTPTPTAGAFLAVAAARMADLKSLTYTLTAQPDGATLTAEITATKADGTVALPDVVSVRATDAAGATSDVPPDSLPFNFEDLGVTLGNIARAIQDPVDSTGAWIDNVQSRGVSGTLSGQQLIGFIPSAAADARITVTMWVDAESMVRRVRIEGAIVPDDPPESVRVLDLGEFK